MLSELGRAAYAQAKSGRRVFPVRPDKRPYVRWTADYTPDERADLVEGEWWTRWPDAHIGMATGRGLVVIDFDPRNGASDNVDPFRFPVTAAALTPSGGRHLYYRVDPKVTVPNSAGVLGPGIDVRGDGGYVVVPPSPGRRWFDDTTPIADLPALVRYAATRPLEVGRAPFEPVDPEYDALVTPGGGPRGGRDNYLAAYAGYLIENDLASTPEDLHAELHYHNGVACDPPLSDHDVTRIARSATRWLENS